MPFHSTSPSLSPASSALSPPFKLLFDCVLNSLCSTMSNHSLTAISNSWSFSSSNFLIHSVTICPCSKLEEAIYSADFWSRVLARAKRVRYFVLMRCSSALNPVRDCVISRMHMVSWLVDNSLQRGRCEANRLAALGIVDVVNGDRL